MAEGQFSLYLAGMKETEGERIVRAIQKLSEKIKKLENERLLSKKRVESLNSQEISTRKAADFFQRLAKAEARSKALQQQLAHVRKIVRGISSVELEYDKANDSSDQSTIFASLCSLNSEGISETSKPWFGQSKYDSQGKVTVDKSPVATSIRNASDSGILETPVFKYFPHSHSSVYGKSGDLFRTQNELDQKTHQHLKKEVVNKTKRASSRCPSDKSSQLESENISIGTTQKSQKRRSRSRNRSISATPLGQFLPASGSKCDLVSHYHVKMKEIPFCSTTKSGKSHSLGANLQNLMSMVKACHPALCSAAPLHRRRTRSADRHGFLHTGKQHTPRQNMTRWNSASALDNFAGRRGHRSLSPQPENKLCKKSTPCVHSDLDYIPVKLNSTKEKADCQKCATPGNVCIKTEIKPLPVGSNKVVEVKMTTSSKPKCECLHKFDSVAKRRELLKDVRELQHMVENDQCC